MNIHIDVPESPLVYPDFLIQFAGRFYGLEHTRVIEPENIKIVTSAKQFSGSVHHIVAKRSNFLIGTVNVIFDFDTDVVNGQSFKNRTFSLKERTVVSNTIADYIEGLLKGLKKLNRISLNQLRSHQIGITDLI